MLPPRCDGTPQMRLRPLDDIIAEFAFKEKSCPAILLSPEELLSAL